MRRQALPDGEQQHRAAGYLLQILRRVASAAHSKAVGGSIPLGVDSYSPLQGKGSHGQSTGLSVKVLFWVALRLPYPLGTPATMRGQALADGEQHQAAGRL